MLALSLILADGVTIKIGDNVWTFGLNFIIYLIIAAIIGLLAEFIVGWRLPFGFIGAIIAALIGIWLMTNVIIITGLPDIKINTTPPVYLLRALIGAIILVAIWHLITYPLYRRRRRYYYRRV
ncbi:MAG TPA: hypothetical protein VKV20_07910 [Ktedonobacteraceae bacterium]|jgi:uncharacterized membrane protein YeaQ/YmgE (transglycosylase-associated protein family)|nr:hypothetical protein [Ktedonobacteraceae bacterium]